MNKFIPEIDEALIQQKTNEYAQKGILKAIDEYYNNWDSPFQKKLKEALAKVEVNYKLELPDIIALINTSLSSQIDEIANSSIAKTYLPQVRTFLRLSDKHVLFSEILKMIIKENSDQDPDKYELVINKDEKYGWLTIELTTPNGTYDITLHSCHDKEYAGKYQALSLPTLKPVYKGAYQQTMTLEIENTAKVVMPFTKDVLRDDVIKIFGNLMLSDSVITMDTQDFEYDMFPDRCHC